MDKKKKTPYYNLINLREDNDLKQKDIADYLFVSPRAYSYYENGERTVPIEVWKKLSVLFDKSIDFLCETKEEYHIKPKKKKKKKKK